MLEFLLSHISVQNLIWLIIVFPLLSFLICGITSLYSRQKQRKEAREFVAGLSVISTILSLACIILVWYILYGLEGALPSAITGPLIVWKGFMEKPIEFGLKVDQLSLSIVFVLAFIGAAIQLYSIGYNVRTRRVSGYFSLLSLLIAFSFLLVLTDNFFLFVIVWQIASVIGFIFITRFFSSSQLVDRGVICYLCEAASGTFFLLTLLIVWKTLSVSPEFNYDIFQFSSIHIASPFLLPYSTIICFSLVIAVVFRSIQFPLYVWFPKANSAPIPVFTFFYAVSSVLISVYLLVRLNFLLILSPLILTVIGIIGGVAVIFGSFSAILQTKLKNILVYFIISQVGFAFVGLGVGAFATTIFHVFTYSIYITVLFLGIGCVISITSNDTIYQVKGLRRYLPVTFWTTLVGALSAVGIYPLGGFFGRMGVIWEAYQRGHGILFIACFLANILIAVALFRMIAVTFFGKEPDRENRIPKVEEVSVSMLTVMMVLAFASIVIGWFGVSSAYGGANHFRSWLEPGLATQMVHVIGDKGQFSELVLSVIVTIVVAHAVLLSLIIYVQKRKWATNLSARFNRTVMLFKNAFYLDALYKFILVRPLYLLSKWVLNKFFNEFVLDVLIIGSVDKFVNGAVPALSGVLTNRFNHYFVWLLCVIIFFLGFIIFY